MIGITRNETHHGNPGERRTLPKGLLVNLQPTTNLPDDSPIKYWASPLPDHPWPADTARWAEDVGVGLHAEDVMVVLDEFWGSTMPSEAKRRELETLCDEHGYFEEGLTEGGYLLHRDGCDAPVQDCTICNSLDEALGIVLEWSLAE